MSWSAVPEAARYEVVARLVTGGQVSTRTTRRSVVLRGIPRWSGGRVTVRALAPQRTGGTTAATFRSVGPRPKSRLVALPHTRGG